MASSSLQSPGKVKAWISAFRLRTLPLALASIGMGSFLAASQGKFNLVIIILCALTTILLQVLSNLANDYGDTQHGADSQHREGPKRAVQAGIITAVEMKKAIYLTALLSLVSGILLLFLALGAHGIYLFFTFLAGACGFNGLNKKGRNIYVSGLSYFLLFNIIFATKHLNFRRKIKNLKITFAR